MQDEVVLMQIRRAVPEDLPAVAKVHVDSWRTTYQDIVPKPFLDNLSYSSAEERFRRILAKRDLQPFMYVAVDSAEGVVGYASGGRARNGPAQFTGELYALYLLKEHQGRGIGSALFRAVASELLSAEMDSMIIWALEANEPACRFYRRMGGEPVAQGNIDIGGQNFPEIAFGWLNLRQFNLHQFTCDP
jgi:GNAT superfamily N-acetyltransferase